MTDFTREEIDELLQNIGVRLESIWDTANAEPATLLTQGLNALALRKRRYGSESVTITVSGRAGSGHVSAAHTIAGNIERLAPGFEVASFKSRESGTTTTFRTQSKHTVSIIVE